MKPSILLTTLVLFLSFACKNKPAEDIEFSDINKYQALVTEVTHGIISVKGDVRVVLNSSIEGWNAGDVLEDNLFSVSPKIKGKTTVLNNRTVVFKPDENFKPDTAYQFTIDLKSIVNDVPPDLETLLFGVKTIKQEFNVYTNELQSYSKDWQYVTGQIKAADVMTVDEIKKIINVTHQDKKVTLKFDSNNESTHFQFRLDSIKRYEEDTKIALKWDGAPLNIETSGENSILIPGKNNFVVLSVAVDLTDKAVVLLNFSDPLKKNQNFKGLVQLTGDDNPKYAVSGNTLKLYPSKELTGAVPVEVFKGIESVDGYKLKTRYSDQVAFERLKPEVRLLTNGTILPSSENLKVNFEAVSLKAVDVQVLRIYENNILQFLQGNALNGASNLRAVGRPIAKKRIKLDGNGKTNKWMAHAIDLKSLITPEPGAIYRVEFIMKPGYADFPCSDTNFDTEDSSTETDYDEAEENSAWDGIENYYEDNYYNYNWQERDNPCNTSFYYGKKVGINVLASDIGVTIKKGTKNYFIAVADIVDTKPIAAAKVSFYNFQQQILGEVQTDADGKASFDTDKQASFAIVAANNQKTYVRLADGNALSVSKFNVSGVALQKGIKGHIFGERGVWRPGDNIYLSFLLNDNANKLPANHPVKLELMDPYNKLVHREVKTTGLNNYYNFTLQTNENAPTGNWLAKVSVGGATFTKSIKIETIKPNRLKIKADFDAEVLNGKKPIIGSLEVLWLHGAIAKNLKADVNAKFNPTTTSFKTFPGYVFDDPSVSFSSVERTIFDGTINNEGKATFTLTPNLEAKAPGMLKAAFVTKVYENGGDFSTDVFTKTYSPYDTYIGLNVPKGDKNRGMLLTDTPHTFEVVSVNEKGQPKATKNLKVSIHKVNWRWWWDTSSNNVSDFNSSNYREKVYEQTISTSSNGKATFKFELKYPDWGRYFVRVEDPNGGHATGKDVYIDWPGWAGKSKKNDPSAATMLLFSTDKETYNVGDKAKVTFPSSEGGRALVTIENGSEVLNSLWVETTKDETNVSLPILTNYTPNVYISIALLQPHANTKNDAPIRMYGVVPIAVENPETKLVPKINMPDVLLPEESVTIKVSEEKGQEMTYSIAIVDDGLLDLTRFKTPNPWDTFYAHEALGVKTWDIYDDVVGAFGGRINQVFSIGGDGALAGAKNKKANRFKPMVVYLGPFHLKAGSTKTHELKMPKYIGSVRTMVIAGNVTNEAYGMAEKTTPVRKPLMVLASLPRKVTPGEKVTLPVTVFAMEKKVKNVTVSIKNNSAFNVVGSNSQSLTFNQPDEKMAYFTLEVTDAQKIGKLIVTASGNGESATFEVPIDVVNPNPVTSEVTSVVLDPSSSKTISLETFGINESNNVAIELSTLPPMNFNGRLQYLIRYPHGCLEQTTSGAFPQLYLSTIFDISADKKARIQGNIEGAIKRIGRMQNTSGGFAYWPGQNMANDWGTSYAGHFLIEANKQGYVLPIGFKSSWISYQKQAAKQWRGTEYNHLTQAYRLYTLALAGSGDIASMNRLRELSNLSNDAKYRLAATYALVGQNKVAETILANTTTNFSDKKDNTYGSKARNLAMALETAVVMQNKSKAHELAKSLAILVNEKSWMSTQSTAYSLLALGKFATLVGGKGIKAKILLDKNKDDVTTDKALATRTYDLNKGSNTLTIENKEGNTLYVTLVNSGILPVGEEKTAQHNLEASVVYKSRNGAIIDVSEIQQGTDFVAEVQLRNTTSNSIKDVALTQIFPSGWEIVNTRFTDFGSFKENNVDYTDIRDDRTHFYFDMNGNQVKTFRVLLNASYLGTYYLPGVQADAMYSNEYTAHTKGEWVEVVN